MDKRKIGLYLSVDDRVFEAISRVPDEPNCCRGCSLEKNPSSCRLSGTGMYRKVCTEFKLRWVEVQS